MCKRTADCVPKLVVTTAREPNRDTAASMILVAGAAANRRWNRRTEIVHHRISIGVSPVVAIPQGSAVCERPAAAARTHISPETASDQLIS
jgi:hypothetical protein